MNGQPFVHPLLFGAFTGNGSWTLQASVPAGLTGLSFTLAVIALNGAGKAVLSNLETLSIQ